MKQNKWIVTSLLLLAGCLLPDRAAAQWKVGVSAGYAYNQYSIDTQYAYDFNFDGRGGVTVGIPVEYGILDWLAVRADFVYLQKGYSMQRAYDQGFRDRRDHYLSLPVMARFSFGGEKLRGFLHAGGYMGYWADSRVKGTEISWDNLIDDFLADNESFVFAPYDRRYEFISKRDNRFDAGLVGGVGVEIKKGRPNARDLLRQVERYLACDELAEIIVVTQKDTPLPARVLGKRVTSVSLNRLWGVALP